VPPRNAHNRRLENTAIIIIAAYPWRRIIQLNRGSDTRGVVSTNPIRPKRRGNERQGKILLRIRGRLLNINTAAIAREKIPQYIAGIGAAGSLIQPLIITEGMANEENTTVQGRDGEAAIKKRPKMAARKIGMLKRYDTVAMFAVR